MKVKNSKNPFYIGYLVEIVAEIWRFIFYFFSKSGELFGAILFTKSFVCVEIIVSSMKNAKMHHKK
jgi:hypothetical protein